jgi:hypothetical protein
MEEPVFSFALDQMELNSVGEIWILMWLLANCFPSSPISESKAAVALDMSGGGRKSPSMIDLPNGVKPR